MPTCHPCLSDTGELSANCVLFRAITKLQAQLLRGGEFSSLMDDTTPGCSVVAELHAIDALCIGSSYTLRLTHAPSLTLHDVLQTRSLHLSKVPCSLTSTEWRTQPWLCWRSGVVPLPCWLAHNLPGPCSAAGRAACDQRALHQPRGAPAL